LLQIELANSRRKNHAMKTLISLVAVACFAGAAFAQQTNPSKAQDSENSAVEATVREFERAVQEFNRDKANSSLTLDARWIENSRPVRFDDEWQPVEKLRAAGIRIAFRVHDFESHVQGNVAWVTLTLDGTFTRNSEGAKNPPHTQAVGECFGTAASDPCESHITFVESEVLVKTSSGWKIALGHTSALPKGKK